MHRSSDTKNSTNITLRVPKELLEIYSHKLLEIEKKNTGVNSLTRNPVIIKAMEFYLKAVLENEKNNKK